MTRVKNISDLKKIGLLVWFVKHLFNKYTIPFYIIILSEITTGILQIYFERGLFLDLWYDNKEIFNLKKIIDGFGF